MRRFVLALLLLAPVTASAQSADTSTQSCVDVRVGTARSYDCLNQRLADVVHSTTRFSAGADAPYGAGSAPNITGQYDRAATQERLGNAFGHGAIAQRPQAVYVNPVAPR